MNHPGAHSFLPERKCNFRATKGFITSKRIRITPPKKLDKNERDSTLLSNPGRKKLPALILFQTSNLFPERRIHSPFLYTVRFFQGLNTRLYLIFVFS